MKKLISYLIVIIFWLLVTTAFGQIQVTQFNAGWNKANDVKWVQTLKDCKTISYTDVAKETEAQKKYKIEVVG